MSEKYCLEVIVVKGDVKYIRRLTEKIMRLKGVEHVRLTSSSWETIEVEVNSKKFLFLYGNLLNEGNTN